MLSRHSVASRASEIVPAVGTSLVFSQARAGAAGDSAATRVTAPARRRRWDTDQGPSVGGRAPAACGALRRMDRQAPGGLRQPVASLDACLSALLSWRAYLSV